MVRCIVSFVVSSLCLLLATSSALAQGGANPPANVPIQCEHRANPPPGCTSLPQYRNPLVLYGYCTIEGARAPGQRTRTLYVSGIFLFDLSRLSSTTVQAAGTDPYQFPWLKEFRDHLVQTQHVELARAGQGVVGCDGATTEAQAKSNFDTVMRSAEPGFSQYVQTGWK